MSVVLDALRRRAGRDAGAADNSSTAGHDRVVSALGYTEPTPRRLSLGMALAYSAGAVAVGFVGLTVALLLLAPPEPQAPGGAPPPAASAEATPDQARPVNPPAPSNPRASPPTESPDEPVAPEVVPRPELASRVPPRPSPADRARPSPSPAPPAAVEPPVDHFGLALYHQRAGDVDRALAEYQAVLSEDEGRADVHNNLGLLFEARGRSDEARRSFERAISIDPRHAPSHNNLGVLLMKGDDSPQSARAADEFRLALASEPHNVESLVNLALLERRVGRTDEARGLLERAATLAPRHAGTHYNLAVVADEAGDRALAIAHYRRFLRYGLATHADLAVHVRARLVVLGAG